MDLGFNGSRYTWTNKRYRNKNNLILKRIDRCLANIHWLHLFPDSSITHLPRTHSDHCPILVELGKNHAPKEKPFRMEPMWCSHSDFPTLIAQAFQDGAGLTHSINTLPSILIPWNREVFDKIFTRNKRILARLA